MSVEPFFLGQAFGKAVCKHYGLDPQMVCGTMTMVIKTDEALTIEVSLLLTPEDIEQIALHMKDQDHG